MCSGLNIRFHVPFRNIPDYSVAARSSNMAADSTRLAERIKNHTRPSATRISGQLDRVYQGAPGQKYSENSLFVMNYVEFVALHIPGSNNNLAATKKECSKKTGREGRKRDSENNVPLGECADATAEYRARNAKNIKWLKQAFAQARARNYAGIRIVIQADIFSRSS